MNKKIRKAIIPAAGLGTRFLASSGKSLTKGSDPCVNLPSTSNLLNKYLLNYV